MATKNVGIKQIHKATTQLPTKELAELMTWLEEYHAQVWDKRSKED